MRENRTYGSEGGEAKNLPYPYLFSESSSRSIFLFEHDLFGKPVPTFPDHGLGSKRFQLG